MSRAGICSRCHSYVPMSPTKIPNRVKKLHWFHNGMKMVCEVGGPLPAYFETRPEPVLAIIDCGDFRDSHPEQDPRNRRPGAGCTRFLPDLLTLRYPTSLGVTQGVYMAHDSTVTWPVTPADTVAFPLAQESGLNKMQKNRKKNLAKASEKKPRIGEKVILIRPDAKKTVPAAAKTKLVLISKRSKRLNLDMKCAKCGVTHNPVWEYAESTWGRVVICSYCKPTRVFVRFSSGSFESGGRRK